MNNSTTRGQTKSKERVRDHGEVFTAEREVKAMCDLVKDETERIDSRFLEPACGDGNFLAEILMRKLAVVRKKYGKSHLDYEKNAVLAASSMHDFVNASDCFTGVEIKGGVCYFLWDRDYHGDCTVFSHSGNKIISTMSRPLLEKNCDTFIRYNDAIQILRKVQALQEKTFDTMVSARKPFGFATDFRNYAKNVDMAHCIKLYYICQIQ